MPFPLLAFVEHLFGHWLDWILPFRRLCWFMQIPPNSLLKMVALNSDLITKISDILWTSFLAVSVLAEKFRPPFLTFSISICFSITFLNYFYKLLLFEEYFMNNIFFINLAFQLNNRILPLFAPCKLFLLFLSLILYLQIYNDCSFFLLLLLLIYVQVATIIITDLSPYFSYFINHITYFFTFSMHFIPFIFIYGKNFPRPIKILFPWVQFFSNISNKFFNIYEKEVCLFIFSEELNPFENVINFLWHFSFFVLFCFFFYKHLSFSLFQSSVSISWIWLLIVILVFCHVFSQLISVNFAKIFLIFCQFFLVLCQFFLVLCHVFHPFITFIYFIRTWLLFFRTWVNSHLLFCLHKC